MPRAAGAPRARRRSSCSARPRPPTPASMSTGSPRATCGSHERSHGRRRRPPGARLRGRDLPLRDVAPRLARGTDLRAEGSGNPGAVLNAAAVLGRRWGMAVLCRRHDPRAPPPPPRGGRWPATPGARRGHRLDCGPHRPRVERVPGRQGRRHVGRGRARPPGSTSPRCVVVATGAAASQQAERSIQLSCVAWTAAAVLWWRRGLPNGWGPTPGPGLPLFAAASSVMDPSRSSGPLGRRS